MSKIVIEINDQSEEFKRGFLAALDFLDGADPVQVSASGPDWVLLEMADNGDNRTFSVEDGRVVFSATGVEV